MFNITAKISDNNGITMMAKPIILNTCGSSLAFIYVKFSLRQIYFTI